MNLYDKYKTSIMDLLSIDEETLNVLQGEYEERNLGSKRKAQLLFLLYIALTFVSKLVFFFKGLKQKYNLRGLDFVFISCPDTVFRTKTIDVIAHGLKYQVIYLPTFHIRAALDYHKFFKGKVDAIFMTFSMGDVFYARKVMNKSQLIKDVKSKYPLEDYYSFWCQMFTYLVYDHFTKRRFGTVKVSETKWILEHQKFYFVPIVHLLKDKGIETVMLQHGSFFKPGFNYFPLYCDKALCCSEREKEVYVQSGVVPERVIVFGAPLQSINVFEKERREEATYDLLILPTMIKDNNKEIHKEVLLYVKEQYPQSKVLVRIRPRSRVDDMAFLNAYIEGFDISEEPALLTDVLRAKKVITFSEDCTFCLLENKKPFIIVSQDEDKESMNGRLACRDNYKVEVQNLLSKDYYCTISKEDKDYLIGETDSHVLHERFLNYVVK